MVDVIIDLPNFLKPALTRSDRRDSANMQSNYLHLPGVNGKRDERDDLSDGAKNRLTNLPRPFTYFVAQRESENYETVACPLTAMRGIDSKIKVDPLFALQFTVKSGRKRMFHEDKLNKRNRK